MDSGLALKHPSFIIRRSSLVYYALLPLAAVYGLAVRWRTVLYEGGWLRRERLPCRVISVGNLTAGGTGKTPVVITFAEWLVARGHRVGVLSRGYRRESREEQVLVSDGTRVLAGPAEAGDEPHLIARRCPGVVVAVGAARSRLGRWVLDRFPLDTLLLDDGFQHLALHRDVDVVLVDASDADGLRAMLPAGRLREPISAAARAQAVLLTRADTTTGIQAVTAALAAAHLPGPPYRVRFSAECLVHAATGAERPLSEARGRTALAVSGIGNASSFRSLLDGLGVRVLDELRFRDHYAYVRGDLARIHGRAGGCGAELVLTTEKDAVKLADFAASDDRLWAVRVRTEFLEGRQELQKLIVGE